LSEDMKKMKGSMQEELDRLKREVERLMREKI
jgi:archaellum component FlaC